jgi:hypothetical protein
VDIVPALVRKLAAREKRKARSNRPDEENKSRKTADPGAENEQVGFMDREGVGTNVAP